MTKQRRISFLELNNSIAFIKYFSYDTFFQFISCKADRPELSFYKIEDFYIEAYKLNLADSSISLINANKFYRGDSFLIGLSFEISFCDSAKKVFKKSWRPSRGYLGVVDKIKNISILLRSEDKKDSVFMSDFYLVENSLDYEVKRGKPDEVGRTNSLSRKGCRVSIDNFIAKVNSVDRCYVMNSLNATYLLYYYNSKRLFDGENILEFHIEFENYSLNRKVSLQMIPALRRM